MEDKQKKLKNFLKNYLQNAFFVLKYVSYDVWLGFRENKTAIVVFHPPMTVLCVK